ncbi:MAG: hypothetical protein ACJ736_16270 [Streptomyces sp.]
MLGAGADDYLVKPCTLSDRRTTPEPVHLADPVLDVPARRCTLHPAPPGNRPQRNEFDRRLGDRPHQPPAPHRIATARSHGYRPER